MPIPQSERVVFRQNVLTSVLCQLRFPPILSIGAKDPAEFQDEIRASYPLYSKDAGVPAQLPQEVRSLLGDMAFGSQAGLARHVFATTDGSRLISLTRDFIAVEEKNYERWERFEPEVMLAANALRKAYQAPFYQRVGLRYRNLIDRTKIPGVGSSNWPELLKPAFLGVLQEDGFLNCVADQRAEIIFSLDEVPGAAVRLIHGLSRSTPGAYFFDADFFKEGQIEHDTIVALLDSFHILAGRLFRFAITPALFNALQPDRL